MSILLLLLLVWCLLWLLLLLDKCWRLRVTWWWFWRLIFSIGLNLLCSNRTWLIHILNRLRERIHKLTDFLINLNRRLRNTSQPKITLQLMQLLRYLPCHFQYITFKNFTNNQFFSLQIIRFLLLNLKLLSDKMELLQLLVVVSWFVF